VRRWRTPLLPALLGAAALSGCHRDEHSTPIESRAALACALAVPRASGPIKTDGEVDEPDWTAAGRSGPFIDARGAEARPFSDARFLWDEQNLYVVLYAADDDIRAKVTAPDGPVWIDDAFSLRLTPAGAGAPTFAIDISATGVVMDARRGRDGKLDASWQSGIALGVDRDGSLNDASDEDEEWVVEAAIPWAALGVSAAAGTRIEIEASRCDTPRGTKERRCGAFGEPKDRRALVLSAPR
jgi:hypothetical protein